MTKETRPRLPDNLYQNPDYAYCTMLNKDLRQILLDTDGKVIACGRLRPILFRRIGLGVHQVWLGDPGRV